MNLYRKYAKAEARYTLDLGDDFELIDFDLDIDIELFKSFIIMLSNNDMCLDEYVSNLLKEMIEKGTI